jgi:hypothetical protein
MKSRKDRANKEGAQAKAGDDNVYEISSSTSYYMALSELYHYSIPSPRDDSAHAVEVENGACWVIARYGWVVEL